MQTVRIQVTRERVFEAADALARARGAREAVSLADIVGRFIDVGGRTARFFGEWRRTGDADPPALEAAIAALRRDFAAGTMAPPPPDEVTGSAPTRRRGVRRPSRHRDFWR